VLGAITLSRCCSFLLPRSFFFSINFQQQNQELIFYTLVVWPIKKFTTNMQYSKSLAILATVGAALGQRPSSTPICDYYTTALLKDNTAKNQYTLLTLLVNTAVIGNYTQPNVGVMVPGILAPGQYNGTDVNLLPYFDGGLKSTNINEKAGVSNFLDGGGAAPLLKNMPADDTTSNQ